MSKSDFIGKYCSSDAIHRLIADGHGIRAALHHNPDWTDAHTDAAVKSKHAPVRMSVASGWDKLNEGHRAALLKDPNEFVRARALQHHLATKTGDELVKYMQDPANAMFHHTACDVGVTENIFQSRHLKTLLKHPDKAIRNMADRELYDRGSDD